MFSAINGGTQIGREVREFKLLSLTRLLEQHEQSHSQQSEITMLQKQFSGLKLDVSSA
jgi:hypothetical protein